MRIHSKTPRVEHLKASGVARPEAEPAEVSFDPKTDLNPQWYRDVNFVLTRWEAGGTINGSNFILSLCNYAIFDSRVRDRMWVLPELREWAVNFLNKQRDAWYRQLTGGQEGDVVVLPWPEIASVIQVIPEVRKLVNSWQVENQLQLSEIWKQLSTFASLHQRVVTLTNLRSLMQAWPDLQPSIRKELVTRKAAESLLATLETLEQADDWHAYTLLAKEMMLVFPDQQPYLRKKLQGHVNPLLTKTACYYPHSTNVLLIARSAVLSAKKAWIDAQGLLRLEYPAQTLACPVSMPDRPHV